MRVPIIIVLCILTLAADQPKMESDQGCSTGLQLSHTNEISPRVWWNQKKLNKFYRCDEGHCHDIETIVCHLTVSYIQYIKCDNPNRNRHNLI